MAAIGSVGRPSRTAASEAGVGTSARNCAVTASPTGAVLWVVVALLVPDPAGPCPVPGVGAGVPVDPTPAADAAVVDAGPVGDAIVISDTGIPDLKHPALSYALRGNILWARGEYEQAADEYRRALASVQEPEPFPDPRPLLTIGLPTSATALAPSLVYTAG